MQVKSFRLIGWFNYLEVEVKYLKSKSWQDLGDFDILIEKYIEAKQLWLYQE